MYAAARPTPSSRAARQTALRADIAFEDIAPVTALAASVAPLRNSAAQKTVNVSSVMNISVGVKRQKCVFSSFISPAFL